MNSFMVTTGLIGIAILGLVLAGVSLMKEIERLNVINDQIAMAEMNSNYYPRLAAVHQQRHAHLHNENIIGFKYE